MKKIISIFLIVIMLASLVAMSVPTSAAEETDLPVKEWDKPWLNESGWTKVETYEQLVAAATAGDKKIYLANDITVGSDPTFTGTTAQTDFIFDGDGHSLIFTQASRSVFNRLNNVTIRNLKLTGSFKAGATGSKNDCSPLGSEVWNYTGKVTVKNLLSDVNITIDNTSNDKAVGGVLQHAGAGSIFEDVVCKGNIKFSLKSDIFVGAIGGIVGFTKGDITFTRCTNEGTIKLPNGEEMRGKYNGGDTKNTCYTGIGGLLGSALHNVSFNDCTNAGEINAVGVHSAIGGFVGLAMAKCSFTNCKNDAPVTQLGAKYNKTNDHSSLTKTEDLDYRGTGGFVGCVVNNEVNTFTNCVNTEKGDVTHSTADSAVNGFGGFVGNAEGEASSRTELKFVFNACANYGDVINGSFLNADGTSTASNSNVARGGFVGIGKSCVKFEFTDCLNAGNVKKGNSDSGGTASYESAGGFIGLERYAGFGGMAGKSGLTKFVNCVNAGDIEGVNSAGGFIGKNFEIKNGASNTDNTYNFAVEFEGCLNTGNISAPCAGGLFGLTSDTDYGGANIVLTAKNSANMGEISANNVAGGILGYMAYGNITVENCVNSGAIKSSASAAGIVGNNATGTVTHKNTEYKVSVTIKDCLNVGMIESKTYDMNASGCGVHTYENNLYCKDILDDWFDEAEPLDLEQSFERLTDMDILACFFSEAEKAVEDANALVADKDKYEDTSYTAFETALEDLALAIDNGPYSRGEDGTLKISDQSDITKLYEALATAKAALRLENTENSEGNGESEQGTEEPSETPTSAPTSAPTDPVEEKKGGCGGVVGGAAVILGAVITLGLGISFKKD